LMSTRPDENISNQTIPVNYKTGSSISPVYSQDSTTRPSIHKYILEQGPVCKGSPRVEALDAVDGGKAGLGTYGDVGLS